MSYETDTPEERAYHALEIAVKKICGNTYREAQAKGVKLRRKHVDYCVPEEAHILTEAMSDVLSGKISVEQAMGLLWGYEVMEKRFGKK